MEIPPLTWIILAGGHLPAWDIRSSCFRGAEERCWMRRLGKQSEWERQRFWYLRRRFVLIYRAVTVEWENRACCGDHTQECVWSG